MINLTHKERKKMARIAKKASISMSQFDQLCAFVMKLGISTKEASKAFTRYSKLKQKR